MGRPDDRGARLTHRFAYHRAIAPLMWAFVGLVTIELVVVHLLVSAWRRDVAIALSLLTLVTMVWLVRAILSFRQLPVTLDADRLVMRVGTIKSMAVPTTNIAGLRTTWDGDVIKARSTLNLALIAYPNILVDLVEPVPMGRRSIRSVAHRLDDAPAFAAAIAALGASA